MTTRLYLPNTGAFSSITPALDTFWQNTSDFLGRIVAVTSRINSTMTQQTSASHATGASTAPTTWLLRQYVYGPLSAQAISGTVKGQIRAATSAVGSYRSVLSIGLCDYAGVRRASGISLYAGAGTTDLLEAEGANAFVTTTLTNRPLVSPSPYTFHSFKAENGDYLLIEIGASKQNTTAATFSFAFGDDSGTDLAEDTSTTTANNPWVEFSQTLTLGTVIPGHRRRSQVSY